jgi:O-antigen/teichoic acid export membrane protein
LSGVRGFDTSLLRRRLLSGSAWAVGGKVCAVGVGLVSNALLARLLSPQEFGTYLLVLSVASLGALVGCLGLNKTAVRFVAESMGLGQQEKTRQTIRLVVGLGLLGSLAASSVYLLIGGYIGRTVFDAPALATVVGLTAGYIAVSTIQELFAETFRGFHDIKLATLFGGLTIGNSAGLVMRLLLLACLIALWFAGGETDLSTVMLIVVGSGSVSALISAWFLYRRTTSLAGPRAEEEGSGIGLKEVLGVSTPMLVNALTVFVLIQADLWIVAAFCSQEQVAIYGAASRFVVLVTMPLMVVNSVLPPVIAEMYARGEKRRLEGTVRPVATLTGAPSLLMLALFALAGGSILGIVYGDFYQSGATVLALLSLGKLAMVWSGSCGLTLQMTGHQSLLMWISIASGVLFVAGALWAVRDFGPVGVAGVAAASMALQNLLTVLAAKWKTGIWTHASFSLVTIKKLVSGRG